MAITQRILDKQLFTLTVAGGGAAGTVDIAIPADVLYLIKCQTMGVQSAASHLSKTLRLYSEYVVGNYNGTVTAPTAVATSSNPFNTALVFAAEANDTGGTTTQAWTINGTNARLTITNNAAAAVDYLVVVDIAGTSNI